MKLASRQQIENKTFVTHIHTGDLITKTIRQRCKATEVKPPKTILCSAQYCSAPKSNGHAQVLVCVWMGVTVREAHAEPDFINYAIYTVYRLQQYLSTKLTSQKSHNHLGVATVSALQAEKSDAF